MHQDFCAPQESLRSPFPSLGLCIVNRTASTVDVAAPPPPERIGAQLPLKLHEAPDLGAIRSDVGLDAGGHLADRGQVDAQQLRALLKRRRDRPAQLRVASIPRPYPGSVLEHKFEQRPEERLGSGQTLNMR
jgi:hypothetical protein